MDKNEESLEAAKADALFEAEMEKRDAEDWLAKTARTWDKIMDMIDGKD
jgi:hypothetical protein